MRTHLLCLASVLLFQFTSHGQELPTAPETMLLRGGRVVSLAFSPDNSLLAVAETHQVVMWDLQNQKIKMRLKDNGKLDYVTVVFSTDGKHLHGRAASRPGMCAMLTWDVSSGEQSSFKEVAGQERFVFSPAAKLALTLDRESKSTIPWIYDFAADKNWSLPKHETAILEMRISPDGSRIMTATAKSIQIWDRKSGKRVHEFPIKGKADPIDPDFVISPDSKRMAAIGYPLHFDLHLFDLESGKRLGNAIVDVWAPIAFMPDGKHLVAGASGKPTNLLVWNIDTRKAVLSLAGSPRRFDFPKIAVSPDGKMVALGNTYGGISVWEIPVLKTPKLPK